MRAMLTRTATVCSTVAVALTISSPAAVAVDLSDLLERAGESTYTATRLTISVWGDQTNVSKERVEHAKGAEMIRVDETWSMVGNGRTVVMGDAPEGIAFMTQPAPVSTDRYEIGSVSTCDHMKRSCNLIAVLEEGRVRAHMLIDSRTGAPLITYVYDGEGRTFRTVSLSDFAPHRTYEWPQDRDDVPLEIVMHDDSSVLPEDLNGYGLIDVFPGPGGSEQGFYADGLFSFSLFAMPGSTVVDGFEDPMTMVTDDGMYDIIPTAKDVRVHWSDGENHFVLVGDLPPDHLDAVLAELPAPDTANVFERWWRALFG